MRWNLFILYPATDEKGNPVDFSSIELTVDAKHAVILLNINETYSFSSKYPERREYRIKYKIPGILGDEQVEELIVLFNFSYGGRFEQAVYNNEKIETIYVKDYLHMELPDDEFLQLFYTGSNALVSDGSYAMINLYVK